MLEVDVALDRGAFAMEAAFRSDAPIVALFGRSGSGKTTLVQAIAGIVRPARGRVEIGGRTPFDSAQGLDLPPERRRVGDVFQDGLLFPHPPVGANPAHRGARPPPAGRLRGR